MWFGEAEKVSLNLILVREGAGNSAASPNSIINDLIFITPDGSTSLNEFQGVVCVDVLVQLSWGSRRRCKTEYYGGA